MKNKFIKGLLVTIITALSFTALSFGQRYVLTILSSLFIGEKVFFVSGDTYIPMYVLGTILFSLTIGWLSYSRILNINSQNFFMLFGLKIKRNILLTCSLLLLIIGSCNFYVFSESKFFSMKVLKGEFFKDVSYSNITNIDIFSRFHLLSMTSNNVLTPRYYCTLIIPVEITTNNNSFKTIIPLGNMEDLATIVKDNKIPYVVQVSNECGDYVIPQVLNSRVENSFGVETNL